MLKQGLFYQPVDNIRARNAGREEDVGWESGKHMAMMRQRKSGNPKILKDESGERALGKEEKRTCS